MYIIRDTEPFIEDILKIGNLFNIKVILFFFFSIKKIFF